MKVRPKDPGDRKSRNRASASRSREKAKQSIIGRPPHPPGPACRHEAELNVERLLDLKDRLMQDIAELSAMASDAGAARFQPSWYGSSSALDFDPSPTLCTPHANAGAGAEQYAAAAFDALVTDNEDISGDDGLPALGDEVTTDVEADWDTMVSRSALW